MRFFNYSGPEIPKKRYVSHQKKENFLFQTLPSFLAAYHSKRQQNSIFFHDWVENNLGPREFIVPSQELSITWLGHASFLIQLGGKVVITDPVFGNLPLFSRLTPLGIPVEHIPPVDIVLLSHNHPDHMDDTSLTYLSYKNWQTAFLVPSGDKRWFSAPHFGQVFEHGWYDKTVIPQKEDDIVITFLPAFHWSRRSISDTNVSLWGSWLIQWKNHAIYFGGDSAYFDHFAEIGSQYAISVALLPVAPIQPIEWMMRSHMSPELAGKAFFDLGAKLFIPMHWGTFHFGIDQFQDPINLLEKWQQNNQKRLDEDKKEIKMLKMGELLWF